MLCGFSSSQTKQQLHDFLLPRFAHFRAQVSYSPDLKSLDHEKLRTDTLIYKKLIRRGTYEKKLSRETWKPSPPSQMASALAFGYCFFYNDSYICQDLLSQAVSKLSEELPALSGRIRPTWLPRGIRKLKTIVIANNDAGIPFSYAKSLNHKIEDLNPSTWASGMKNRRLSEFGVPFYAEDFNARKLFKGEEALFKVKLTECCDGQILSITISHLLADARRALILMERLSQIYNSLKYKVSRGASLIYMPNLETVDGLASATGGKPKGWLPWSPDYNLTIKQWLMAPFLMFKHINQRFDLHLIYLPNDTLQRLKKIALGENIQSSINGGYHCNISTMDALQAFLATLIADLRKWPLVPVFPQEITVNVDLLQSIQEWKDPKSASRHIGNLVHILHVPGNKETDETNCSVYHGDNDSDEYVLRKFTESIQSNALLIRKNLTDFRSDTTGALCALQRQKEMASMSEGRVAATYVVKGFDMKLASSSAVTFPFDKVGICIPIKTEKEFLIR